MCRTNEAYVRVLCLAFLLSRGYGMECNELVQQACAIILVEDYLLNGFLVSGFEVTMTISY